eukprot:scaffold45105_cov275-Amphora_coffeaeformis.AAC.2
MSAMYRRVLACVKASRVDEPLFHRIIGGKEGHACCQRGRKRSRSVNTISETVVDSKISGEFQKTIR